MNIYNSIIVLFLTLFVINSDNLTASFSHYNKPISVDSRIKTFVYNPNEVFTVVFSQGYYSYIEFSEGEKIKNIAVGDASSWKISPYDNKLLITPFEVNSHTNMIITTTKKRNYIFDLISRSNLDKDKNNNDEKISSDYYSEKDISYVVRFYYPKEEDELDISLDELPILSDIQMQHFVDELGDIVQENDTKYNYIYIENSNITNDIIPIELFDDGYLTYFKFKNNNKIPQILIENNKKNTMLACKRLLFNGYIIIKGVHKRLFIRYDNNEIEIINKLLL